MSRIPSPPLIGPGLRPRSSNSPTHITDLRTKDKLPPTAPLSALCACCPPPCARRPALCVRYPLTPYISARAGRSALPPPAPPLCASLDAARGRALSPPLPLSGLCALRALPPSLCHCVCSAPLSERLSRGCDSGALRAAAALRAALRVAICAALRAALRSSARGSRQVGPLTLGIHG